MMKRTAQGLLRVGVPLLSAIALALGGVWMWNSNVRVPATAHDPIELEGSTSDRPGRAMTGPPQERGPGSSDGATPVSNQPLPAGVTSTGDDDAAATTQDADDAPDDSAGGGHDVGSDDDVDDADPVADDDDRDDGDSDDDDDERDGDDADDDDDDDD